MPRPCHETGSISERIGFEQMGREASQNAEANQRALKPRELKFENWRVYALRDLQSIIQCVIARRQRRYCTWRCAAMPDGVRCMCVVFVLYVPCNCIVPGWRMHAMGLAECLSRAVLPLTIHFGLPCVSACLIMAACLPVPFPATAFPCSRPCHLPTVIRHCWCWPASWP